MYLRIISLICFAFILGFSVFSTTQAQAQYLPVGPQTDVPVATVENGGWTECYRDIYANDLDADFVLSQCSGQRLMLACRMTGSQTLILLAQGLARDVTYDTGNDNPDVTHVANGVGWYFNEKFNDFEETGGAWGFARAGDSVIKFNCDFDTSGANDERLCWHLQPDAGGFRCGATQDLNSMDEGSENYERIVYVMGDATRPIPTLSQWGLLALAAFMGIVGFMMLRRKARA